MGADGMTTRCEVSAARHRLTPGPSPRETRPVAAPSQGRPSLGSGGTGACPKAPVTRAGHRSSATGATGAVLGRKSLEQLSGGGLVPRKPFRVSLFHGERFFFCFLPRPRPGSGLGRAAWPAAWPACWLCFATLAPPASIPLAYSERKTSARRCLLCIFFRRSGLKNSNSKRKRNFVIFFFPIWKAADGSCFQSCRSDISLLTEVQSLQ